MKTLLHLAGSGTTKPAVKSRCALAIVLLLAAAGDGTSAGASTNALQTLTSGNTAFALDVYQQLKMREGNLFFSPFSLSSALAMTYAGACGQTASEMVRVLHFTLPQAELPAAFTSLNQRLAEIGNGKQVTLNVANSLWAQRGQHFLESFLDLNRNHFGAEVGLVDFERQTEPARREINAWVAKETAGKIKEAVASDQVNKLTRLVLCNAIYFRGDWAEQFDPQATKPMDFFVSPGRSAKAPMMFRELYVKGLSLFSDVSALELRYRDAGLSMIVILPDAVDGLGKLESRLSPPQLAKLFRDLDHFTASKTMVFLPRFKLSSQFNLTELLSKMGMPSAFDLSTADFSRMTGARDLFISAITHQAVVEVNEQGTEAAAATTSFAERGGPAVFRADHPFLFLIREVETGSILFLGRVVDPTK